MSTDPRVRSPSEDRANVLSHAVGLVAAIGGTGFLVATAPDALWRVARGLFGSAAMFMLLSSVFYHASAGTRREAQWLRLDYSSVFLLIAGSYTPVAAALLPAPAGWGLLVAVWVVALVGVTWSLLGRTPAFWAYVVHASLGLPLLPAIGEAIGTDGLVLLAGGIGAYLVGSAFYFANRLPYNHLWWHLGVLVGVGLHFAAVAAYLPPS